MQLVNLAFILFAGIPICIVAASMEYRPAHLETSSRYLQSRVLFLCFALLLHFLSCIIAERYLTITSRTSKITIPVARIVATIITLYVAIFWIMIIADDVCDYADSSTITICSFENRISPSYLSSSRVPLIIITIWMSSCNFISCLATSRTIIFIKRVLEDSQRRFGVSSRRVETRRLTVVYLLSLFYTVVWVPYGVISARRTQMDRLLASILELYFEIFCYVSFLAVPFAFYLMDKGFAEYMKSTVRRNRPQIGKYLAKSNLGTSNPVLAIENGANHNTNEMTL